MILILTLALTTAVVAFALFLRTLNRLAEHALKDPQPTPTRSAHNNRRHP